MPHLVQQNFERGKVGIPLDQRRHWTEAPERRGVEIPDGIGNSGSVVVDQDIDVFGGVMASEMDLADRLDRQRIEIRDRVEPKIFTTDADVVNVAEDAAARPARDFGQEFRLRN
jgi:hypothetical protein